MQHSDTLGNLAAALAKVQGQLRPAAENATNPFFRSKYADLGSVWDAARDLLAANGLSVVQFPTSGEPVPFATREPAQQKGEPDKLVVVETATIGLTTTLMHESGEWLSHTIYLPVTEEKGRSPAQAAGSIISYLRRYGLSAALGIVTGEDNDAEMPRAPQPQRKPAAKPAPVEFDDIPAAQPANGDQPKLVTAAQLRQLHKVGTERYGPDWNTKCPELVRAVTKGRAESSKELTVDEHIKLINGMLAALEAPPAQP